MIQLLFFFSYYFKYSKRLFHIYSFSFYFLNTKQRRMERILQKIKLICLFFHTFLMFPKNIHLKTLKIPFNIFFICLYINRNFLLFFEGLKENFIEGEFINYVSKKPKFNKVEHLRFYELNLFLY